MILDLLEANLIKATFFIPGWVAEHYPDVVAEIYRRGHEVGAHGYLHESLEGLSLAEEEEILLKTSRVLAGITGVNPVGYRAPLFEITEHTIELLRKHSFLYASNLMDTLWPYPHPGSPPIVELPVNWMLDDGAYYFFSHRPPPSRPIFPSPAVLSIWKSEFCGVHELGGAFTLILHPQLSGRPSRLSALQELIDYVRQFEGVWFARGVDIARHVIGRVTGVTVKKDVESGLDQRGRK